MIRYNYWHLNKVQRRLFKSQTLRIRRIKTSRFHKMDQLKDQVAFKSSRFVRDAIYMDKQNY